jgi:twinkle protein
MEIKPELEAYLRQKGWTYKPAQSGNIALDSCPFCKRASKFWIHTKKTVYRCWSAQCNERGNLTKLQRAMGDRVTARRGREKVASAASLAGDGKQKSRPVPLEHVERWHKALLKDRPALEYLTERGFERATVEHFRLGLRRKGGTRWLVIPHLAGGKCENIKQRSLPPADKTFRRHKGAASILFNSDALASSDTVVLVEAETDAMSFWQAGVKNVVSLTCGAGSFLPEWYGLLEYKERIVIAMDADEDGQAGAREIARRLGYDRCFNVLLPLKDANAVLSDLGPQELAATLDTAEQFEVEGIVSAADVIARARDEQEVEDQGLSTPWDSVNAMMPTGAQLGDLIVLSARVKVGKTTLALQWAKHCADSGDPALIFCLEMRPTRLIKKLVGHVRQKDYQALNRVDYNVARYHLRGTPLYFVEPDWGGELKAESVLELIRDSVRRYGVRFLVFDNLHFLCRSLQYVTTEVGQITRAFKQLAEELEIVVCLIAQPKKIDGDRVMRYNDLKDSAAIPADADTVIILHREARAAGLSANVSDASDVEVLDPRTLFRIDAQRFGGGGECYLYYEGETATFFEMSDAPKR